MIDNVLDDKQHVVTVVSTQVQFTQITFSEFHTGIKFNVFQEG